ncbi:MULTISPECIES: NAD(P)H-dependent oxidoreductase [Komagataeibacter]|uniref:NAD(P)H-dependent oxidoreductase n=1 Tax=Komagataeibacter TaxID=1434011 RepID=UPI00104BD82B|nr:NAD(P)H-dependent oxidoreductase [Komagataeibacter saccharivorans]QBL93761.1 Modulator of drug activity B [Komagataeibacter saccharivorans]
MKKIFLINGGKAFAHSHGRLNATLHDIAAEHLTAAGFEIRRTTIDAGYDIETEIENHLWADALIHQFPAWWMGVPWTVKKYLDEVLTAGHGRLYANDGRSRAHPERHYGSGGLLDNRRYMISTTWNAPQEAFTDPAQFFEGRGVDAVFFPFHKALEFLGMSGLPTFLATDVIKAPAVDVTLSRYRQHLGEVFGNAA